MYQTPNQDHQYEYIYPLTKFKIKADDSDYEQDQDVTNLQLASSLSESDQLLASSTTQSSDYEDDNLTVTGSSSNTFIRRPMTMQPNSAYIWETRTRQPMFKSNMNPNGASNRNLNYSTANLVLPRLSTSSSYVSSESSSFQYYPINPDTGILTVNVNPAANSLYQNNRIAPPPPISPSVCSFPSPPTPPPPPPPVPRNYENVVNIQNIPVHCSEIDYATPITKYTTFCRRNCPDSGENSMVCYNGHDTSSQQESTNRSTISRKSYTSNWVNTSGSPNMKRYSETQLNSICMNGGYMPESDDDDQSTQYEFKTWVKSDKKQIKRLSANEHRTPTNKFDQRKSVYAFDNHVASTTSDLYQNNFPLVDLKKRFDKMNSSKFLGDLSDYEERKPIDDINYSAIFFKKLFKAAKVCAKVLLILLVICVCILIACIIGFLVYNEIYAYQNNLEPRLFKTWYLMDSRPTDTALSRPLDQPHLNSSELSANSSIISSSPFSSLT